MTKNTTAQDLTTTYINNSWTIQKNDDGAHIGSIRKVEAFGSGYQVVLFLEGGAAVTAHAKSKEAALEKALAEWNEAA